jgi:hypothetical protein
VLSNLLIRTLSCLSFLDIPTGNVLLRNASLQEQVNGTSATSAKRTQNHGGRLAAQGLLCRCEVLADLVHELLLVEVVSTAVSESAHGGKLLAGMSELPLKRLQAKCSTSETSVEAKCGPKVR